MRKWIQILASLVLLALAIAPAVATAQQPACTEYCYDPIPNPGNGSGSPNGGASVSPSAAGGSHSDGKAGAADSASGRGGKRGDDGSGTKPSERAASRGDEGSDELNAAPVAASNTGSGSDGGAAVGSSALSLTVLLLLVTGLILSFAYRKQAGGEADRTGLVARLGAFAVVVVLLLVLGAGSAVASKTSAPKGFYGMMSIDAIDESDASRMAAGGVESYRMPFSWDLIQLDSQSAYDWSSIDSSVGAAATAGVRVLPIMYGTPAGYANKPTKLPIENSKQRQGWAAFLRAAVQRYGPRGDFWTENPAVPELPIRTWQIWNEANFFYFATPVSPRNYVKLLKASHRVLEGADGNSKVMLSGLFGSPRETPGRAMKSARFIDKIYRLGGRRFFDSVAIHPYTPNTGQLRRLLKQVRKTLIQHGGRKTPMHVTEIGWGSDSATVFGMGNRSKQARQLTSGYNLMLEMRRYLNLRSVYWFAWKDIRRNVETCNFCYSSGLFQAGDQLKPKPAWKSLVRVVKRSRR